MKLTFERIVLLVLDSVGIGALPAAADYGDAGRDGRTGLRAGTSPRGELPQRGHPIAR